MSSDSMALGVEIVGWTGAVLVLGAYILVSMGRLSGSSPPFQWMNALGAGFFALWRLYRRGRA